MKRQLHVLLAASILLLTQGITQAIRFDMGTGDYRLEYTDIAPETAMMLIKSYITLWTNIAENPKLTFAALQDFESRLAEIDAENIEWHLTYVCSVINHIRTMFPDREDQKAQYEKGRAGFTKICKIIPMIAFMESQMQDHDDDDTEQEID